MNEEQLNQFIDENSVQLDLDFEDDEIMQSFEDFMESEEEDEDYNE